MKITNNKGAVAPLVAILLFVILVCVALVVDLGHTHNVKIQLQRAVDAAALAGAQVLSPGDFGSAATEVATDVIERNFVDNEKIENLNSSEFLKILTGEWVSNPEKFSLPVYEEGEDSRFTPLSTTDINPNRNAIYVRAKLKVDPVFFFFMQPKEIYADAVAVQSFEKVSVPIAIVTCIAMGDTSVVTPSENICDLSLFSVRNGDGDNSGWTGLTITPAGPQAAELFMNPDTKDLSFRLFNQIIYGNNNFDGLETAPVKKTGCTVADNETPHSQVIDSGLNPIVCGLGGEFEGPLLADPLASSPLPRWYEDEFQDLVTLNSLLVSGTGEETEYIIPPAEDGLYVPGQTKFQVRMIDLYNASLSNDFSSYNTKYNSIGMSVPDIMKDDRYQDYLDIKTIGSGQLFENIEYAKVIEDAGYPLVDITNGVTNITDFLIDITSNRDTNKFIKNGTGSYPILDGSVADVYASGKTVMLTVPIIYGYECTRDETKDINEINFAHPGLYVGLANVLLTRLWDANKSDGYDAGDDAVSISVTEATLNNDLCREKLDRFNPAKTGLFGDNETDYKLPALGSGRIINVDGFAGKTFEGMLQSPEIAEKSEAGLIKVYLVE